MDKYQMELGPGQTHKYNLNEEQNNDGIQLRAVSSLPALQTVVRMMIGRYWRCQSCSVSRPASGAARRRKEICGGGGELYDRLV